MNPPADPTVIGLVTAGLSEVKEALTQLSRDLHGTLARLPTDYVPRREVERRLDEMTIDLGAERAERLSAVAALQAAADKATADRREHVRWMVGLALATIVSLLGVLVGVILHFV